MKCLFQATTITIKPGFERYTNKKWRKILLLKKWKPKNKVSYSKSLAKMKY